MVRPAIVVCGFSFLILICVSTLITSIVLPVSIKNDLKKYNTGNDNDNDNEHGRDNDPEVPDLDTSQENVEVWLIDQSNTFSSLKDDNLDSGGTIHIYRNKTLYKEIDIGEMCEWIFEKTGAYPVRPHYIEFNTCNTHAIISFVVSGHVLIMDINNYTPIYVTKVGEQAHTAIPSSSSEYLLVTDQNGKKLHRINTDFQNELFEFDEDASIDLDAVLDDIDIFPDNAPILAVPSHNNKFGFVTLRGGGFLVIRADQTPMIVEKEFGNDFVEPNGLFALEHDGKVYFNSGGGGGDNADFDGYGYQNILYVYDQTTGEVPDLLFKKGGVTDGHGMVLIGNYLWIADISDDSIIVFDTKNNHIRNNIKLPNNAAPDLMTYSNGYVYVSYKGPIPLTGNNPDFNNAKGVIPGMGVIKVLKDGASAEYIETLRITHIRDNDEHADPHAIKSRQIIGGEILSVC